MRAELIKWKADVLGFRGEMRNGQSAQLAMTTRILKLLGAEAGPPPAATTQPATTEPSGAVAHK